MVLIPGLSSAFRPHGSSNEPGDLFLPLYFYPCMHTHTEPPTLLLLFVELASGGNLPPEKSVACHPLQMNLLKSGVHFSPAVD